MELNSMLSDIAESSSHNNGDNTVNNMLSRNQYMETRWSKFLMTPVISLRTRTVLRDGSGLTVAKPLSRLFNQIQIANLQKEGKINKPRRSTHKKLLNPKTESEQQHEKGNIISKSTTNNESGVNFMPHTEEIQRQSSSTPSSTGSSQLLSKEDVQLLEKDLEDVILCDDLLDTISQLPTSQDHLQGP